LQAGAMPARGQRRGAGSPARTARRLCSAARPNKRSSLNIDRVFPDTAASPPPSPRSTAPRAALPPARTRAHPPNDVHGAHSTDAVVLVAIEVQEPRADEVCHVLVRLAPAWRVFMFTRAHTRAQTDTRTRRESACTWRARAQTHTHTHTHTRPAEKRLLKASLSSLSLHTHTYVRTHTHTHAHAHTPYRGTVARFRGGGGGSSTGHACWWEDAPSRVVEKKLRGELDSPLAAPPFAQM